MLRSPSSLRNPFQRPSHQSEIRRPMIPTLLSRIVQSYHFTSTATPILLLLCCIPLLILYSIYLDTLVGGKLFYVRSITQTELDTQLKNILPKIPTGGIIPPPSALVTPTPITAAPGNNAPNNRTNATLPSSYSVLKPTIGMHRPHKDAIFAVADGMTLRQLALFIITLRNTGFEGDVVFSTWSREYLTRDVVEFLEYHSQSGLIVYEGVIIADHENQTIRREEVESTNVWLKGLYGREKYGEVYHDPRPARSLGIARFEVRI